MLSIEINCGGKGSNEWRDWHVGERLPIEFDNIHMVVSIQADGDELRKIVRTIKGIPYSDARVQRWFGDDAKFIAANLEH